MTSSLMEGFTWSGSGQAKSTYSFDPYTVVKHVVVERTGDVRPDWHRTVISEQG